MLTSLSPEQNQVKPMWLDLNDNTVGDPGHHPRNKPSDDDSDGSHCSWSPVIKPRRRFSSSETKILESEFVKDSNPSAQVVSEIAKTMGTTRRIITTWFQNHRAKEKRILRNKPKPKKIIKKQNRREKKKTKICMNAECEIESSVPAFGPLDEEATNVYGYNTSFDGSDCMNFDFVWDQLSPLSMPLTPLPIISWSQSPVPCHYWTSPLAPCCLDEMLTGIPCTLPNPYQ